MKDSQEGFTSFLAVKVMMEGDLGLTWQLSGGQKETGVGASRAYVPDDTVEPLNWPDHLCI